MGSIHPVWGHVLDPTGSQRKKRSCSASMSQNPEYDVLCKITCKEKDDNTFLLRLLDCLRHKQASQLQQRALQEFTTDCERR